jgi:hypothetical protein
MKIRLILLYSLILRPEDSINFYQIRCPHIPDESTVQNDLS